MTKIDGTANLSEDEALDRLFGDNTDSAAQSQINDLLSGLGGTALSPDDSALTDTQAAISALLPAGAGEDQSSMLDMLISMQSTAPDTDYSSIAESLIHAGGNLSVTVQDKLFIEGDINLGAAMTLSTQGDLLNGGRINAGGNATFSTTGVFKNDTTLADYSTTDGELFVGGDGGTFGDRRAHQQR